jgi:S1-C subfamily serine protease
LGVVADLKSLRYLMLHGTPITDDGLVHLQEMKQLLQLQIYGTDATPQGAAKLAAALPNTEVHFRLGALLGIKGMVGFQGGAVVESVQEDTAAAAADLRRGDMIVKYGDQAINSFEELTERIAKCKPGDKARLEIVRGGETISKEITFGAWK